MRRRFLAGVAAFFAALSLFAQYAVVVRAAPAVEVRNISGALSANAGTHYEFSAGANYITFDVYASGIPEGASMFLRTSVSGGECVSNVFPTRSALVSGVASPVSIELRPNASSKEAFGEILLTYEYVEDIAEPPPKATIIKITQRGAASAAASEIVPEMQQASYAEEEAIIALLESTVQMPAVAFVGNEATLTYSGQGPISWSGSGSGAQITIRDVSVLEQGVPIDIPDYQPTVRGVLSENKYLVTIPAEQINYVLQKRADEIVNSLPGELIMAEDVRRTKGENVYLASVYEANLPVGAAISVNNENLSVPDDGSFGLFANASWLSENMGEDMEIACRLLYKGVPAASDITLLLELSFSELFPSVTAAKGGGQTEAAASSAAEALAPRSGNGLFQTYDSDSALFTQQLSENWSFTSNIPNGLVTNDPVKLTFQNGIEYTVLRNDEEYPYINGASISGGGCYRVHITATEKVKSELDNIPSEITLGELQEVTELTLPELLDESGSTRTFEGTFSFRIVEGKTNGLPFFNPPPGFKITGLTFGDIPVTNYSKDFVRLTTDGAYRFTVSAGRNGPEFVTVIERFTQPPQISLDGVENGMATKKSVKYEATGAGGAEIAAIDVRLGTVSVSAHDNTVSSPGEYVITATDTAGNTSSVTFRILYTVNVSGWWLLAITITLFGGLAGLMFYLRTHMRVR